MVETEIFLSLTEYLISTKVCSGRGHMLSPTIEKQLWVHVQCLYETTSVINYSHKKITGKGESKTLSFIYLASFNRYSKTSLRYLLRRNTTLKKFATDEKWRMCTTLF